MASEPLAVSTWVKVLNRGYSQMVGREELFEGERDKPVPAWHYCVVRLP